MDIRFIAGFGPITPAGSPATEFWGTAFGIPFHELAPNYFHADGLDGARTFGLWPLDQAAESTFGTATWPTDHPVPQAWIEFDVGAPEEVVAAAAELIAAGHSLLKPVGEEPWGQWTCRLQSPEGLLVGVSYTPWMHDDPAAPA